MSGLAAAVSLPPTLFADRVRLLGTEEAFKLGALIRVVEQGGPG